MSKKASVHRIGILSDTHGLLRPEVVEAFQGVDRIIHAGDIDTPEVLRSLRKIAPVTAVRGNMDRGGWAQILPRTEVVDVNGTLMYVLHDIHTLDLDPAAADISVVVFGHSHLPAVNRKNGVLYLNPGSAGFRRFNKPISLAILEFQKDRVEPKILELGV